MKARRTLIGFRVSVDAGGPSRRYWIDSATSKPRLFATATHALNVGARGLALEVGDHLAHKIRVRPVYRVAPGSLSERAAIVDWLRTGDERTLFMAQQIELGMHHRRGEEIPS